MTKTPLSKKIFEEVKEWYWNEVDINCYSDDGFERKINSVINKTLSLKDDDLRQTLKEVMSEIDNLISEQDKIVRDLHDLFTAAKRRLLEFV